MKKHRILSLFGIVFALCLSLWARGQTTITLDGPDTVCVSSTGSYLVNSPTSNVTYFWSTTMGTVQGTGIGSSTNILWGNTGGTATITVNGYDQSNTLVENGTLNVDLVSLPQPKIKSNYRVACIGSYTGKNPNQGNENWADTLFLDDKYGCPKACEYSEVEYEVDGYSGDYSWSVNGGTIQGSSTGSIVTVLWGAAGPGSITVEEYYGACTLTKTICIDIIEKPIAAFAVLPNTAAQDCETFDICLNSKAAFKDLSTGSTNSQIVSWYWDFGDNTTSSQQNPPPHEYPGPGLYEVLLTVTNECGCKSTQCAYINVYEDPGPPIFCQAVACENDSVRYCTDVQCGTYDWVAVGGTIVTNDDTCITVVWDQLADNENFGYISLAVVCTDLCPAYTTIKVPVVKSNPVITGHDKLCVGNEYKFSVPLWPGTEYNWGVLNNSSAVVSGRNSNEVVLNFSSAGTYDVHATWKNHISICGGDTTFQVTVMGNDNIVGPVSACKSSTATVQYTMNSTNSADWRLTDPTGSVSTTSGTTYNASFTMAGTYKLEATNYCADPLLIVVTELTETVDSVDGEDTVCVGQPYVYNAYSSSPGTVFTWAVVDGTIHGSNVGSSVTVVWNSPFGGGLSVSKQSVNYPYCTGPATIVNIITGATPHITGPDTVCSDSYFPYSSNFVAKDASYTWKVIPHTAGNIQSGTYDPDIVFKANKITTPTSVEIIVDVQKCGQTYSDTIEVVIMPSIIPTLTAPDTVCSGDAVQMTTEPGAGTYHWTFGDQAVDNTDTPYTTHVYWHSDTNGVFKIVYPKVKASGTDGSQQCPPLGESDRKPIVIRPGPLVSISTTGTLIYCDGDPISTLLTSNVVPGTVNGTPTYQWYERTGGAISGATGSTYTATAAGFYYVVVTDTSTGCIGKSGMIVIVSYDCNPGPGCTGSISVTANGPCTPVLATGTGVDANHINPEFFDASGTASSIDHTAGNNTAYFHYDVAGVHSVGYWMDVKQAGGDFCKRVDVTTVTVPLVPVYELETNCGTGQYDFTLIDRSSYIEGYPSGASSSPNYTETLWDIYNNPSFAGTASATSNIAITTPFSFNLTGGTYYLRMTTDLYEQGNTIPVGTCVRTFTLNLPIWPVVSFTKAPSSICEGIPVEFEADLTPWYMYVKEYSWDFGDVTASAVNPTYRVYDYTQVGLPPQTYLPSLTITDQYNCVHTSATQQVDIYENNITGTISGGASVCTGPVTLNYNSGTGTPFRYMWSDVGVFTTNSSHQVNTSGTYFVAVEDAQACRYVTTPPEDVIVVNLQNTGILGRTDYCLGEEVFLSGYAGTDNLTYNWERDNSAVGGNDPYLFDPGLAANTYSYDLEIVYNDGNIVCSTSAGPISVTVNTPPGPPTITQLNVLDCQKYELELVGSAPGGGTLQWANGPTSSNYTIYSGGPYRLFFYDNNGCVSHTDTLVPPAPETFFGWFPDGCYELCEDQFPFWLYGPPGNWSYWEWRAMGGAGNTVNGTNSTVPPYQVVAADDYTLELDNGLCSQVSDIMSVTSKNCGACQNIFVDIQLFCDQSNPGGYTLILDLNNPYPGDLDVNVAFGSGPIKPVKLNLPSGAHQYNLYGVTMQGPPDTLEISYTLPGGRKCFFRQHISPGQYTYPCSNWPSQKPGKTTAIGKNNLGEEVQTGMLVFPNPANQSVTINYNYGAANESRRRIMVYDITGRRVMETPVTEHSASHQLDVSNWTQGVYVVRMEEDGRAVHTARITITH